MDVFVVLLAMLVLKLASTLRKLLKSAVHRTETNTQATLIKAHAEADYTRSRGKAEIIRARGRARGVTGAGDGRGGKKRG
ncbi:hypothetical protein [Streptomyces zhihengii]